MTALTLPTPSAEALQHSQRVVAGLKQDLFQHNAVISFADYMNYVLYQPGLGYYTVGTEKFGPRGDFTTAPELSPLFAYALGAQCHQVLQDIGGGIVEFGAGSGRLAAYLLEYLTQNNCHPQHYTIIEVSAELQQRQRETIQAICPELLSQVIWLQQLPTEPAHGIVIANEVLDAMPVNIFCYQQQQLFERCVTLENDRLLWTLNADHQLSELVSPLFEQPPQHYISEVNPWVEPWIASISQCLEQGVVLLIDYGYPQREYYHSTRHMGTLMCHYSHYAHDDPFVYPGIQDITAHVDFTAVARAGKQHGLAIKGYCPQASFLLSCGILDMAQGMTTQQCYEFAQQIKMLTMPHEMGELFKAIAMTKNYQAPLLGFAMQNQRGKL